MKFINLQRDSCNGGGGEGRGGEGREGEREGLIGQEQRTVVKFQLIR